MTNGQDNRRIGCYECPGSARKIRRIDDSTVALLCENGHAWQEYVPLERCARCEVTREEHVELKFFGTGSFLVCPALIKDHLYLKKS